MIAFQSKKAPTLPDRGALIKALCFEASRLGSVKVWPSVVPYLNPEGFSGFSL